MTPEQERANAAHLEWVEKTYASQRDVEGRFAVGWASVAHYIEVVLNATARFEISRGVQVPPIDADGGVIFADATLELEPMRCGVWDDTEQPDELTRFPIEVRALLPSDGRLRAIVFADKARTAWQIRQVNADGSLSEPAYSQRCNPKKPN